MYAQPIDSISRLKIKYLTLMIHFYHLVAIIDADTVICLVKSTSHRNNGLIRRCREINGTLKQWLLMRYSLFDQLDGYVQFRQFKGIISIVSIKGAPFLITLTS